jgi:hypothetical protein
MAAFGYEPLGRGVSNDPRVSLLFRLEIAGRLASGTTTLAYSAGGFKRHFLIVQQRVSPLSFAEISKLSKKIFPRIL